VIGLPHPELGEELAAIVVYRVEAPPPSEKQLAQHLQSLIAYFAIPTRWRITSQPLPTIAGEKVDKKNLAVEFA
jgi:acyl-CoA synthetase (AMP-forming)/AMP-acid ligase II